MLKLEELGHLTDDLAVQLSIATICYDPEVGKPKAAPVARPQSEDTP